MARPYSDDLRARAIAIVEGGASRHEVAALFEVSPSSVINWLRRWRDEGSAAAKPSGGSVSPLEKHAGLLLALIAEHPDLTLDEAVAAMRKRRIVGSRSALSRFFIQSSGLSLTSALNCLNSSIEISRSLSQKDSLIAIGTALELEPRTAPRGILTIVKFNGVCHQSLLLLGCGVGSIAGGLNPHWRSAQLAAL